MERSLNCKSSVFFGRLAGRFLLFFSHRRVLVLPYGREVEELNESL